MLNKKDLDKFKEKYENDKNNILRQRMLNKVKLVDLIQDQNTELTKNVQEGLNNITPNQEVNVISAAVEQASKSELFSGMVTFDYNNVPITDIVNSIILMVGCSDKKNDIHKWHIEDIAILWHVTADEEIHLLI